VFYEEDIWTELTKNLKTFDANTRSQLITDSLTFSKLLDNNQLSYNTSLELTKSLSTENEYLTLAAVLDEMDFLRNYLIDYEYFRVSLSLVNYNGNKDFCSHFKREFSASFFI
jgi:hypothetical protein